MLAQVGSAEIAALFGFIVQAAREGMAVVFDNAVTGAAALGAVTAYPEIRDYLFPSAVYDEPVHQMQLSKLGMEDTSIIISLKEKDSAPCWACPSSTRPCAC